MLSVHEVERFYQDLPQTQLEIVLELRNLIASVFPQASEVIQWKGLSYFDAARGGTVSAGICQIRVYRGSVELGFVHGALLPDPLHLLQGSGKAKRVVRLDSFETAPWPALRDLIAASSRFDPYTQSFLEK